MEKISASEKKKYVLSEEDDFEILLRCKALEKLRLEEEDKAIVMLAKSQLEHDWRKPLSKALKRLERKYAR